MNGSENPARLDGIAFLEFCGATTAYYAELFNKLGMVAAGRSANGDLCIYRQDAICFVVNHREGSFAAKFAAAHGPCVSALGFRTRDAAAASSVARAHGLAFHDMSPRQKTVDAPVLLGIGGSGLYLVEADREDRLLGALAPGYEHRGPYEGIGLVEVDHLTHNVREGEHRKWVDFYGDVFGFRTVFEMEVPGKRTAMRTSALISPCGRFRIAINEPTQPTSQIQEFIDQMKGEGVQHIALASHDLYDSVRHLRDSDLPFQQTPQTYYEMVDERLPGHGEDLQRLADLGILLDGEKSGERSETGEWGLLMQIFSRNLVGPAFFEFIQRKGNDGFGEGNAKALFESIELEQMQRGVVDA